jgi:hypothetical protein
MNSLLHHLATLNPNDYPDSMSLEDYLRQQEGMSEVTIEMANAGFSNTLCTSSKLLSLKRCIQWENLWHGEEATATTTPPSSSSSTAAGGGEHGEKDEEEEEEHDYTFVESFSCLVNYLKENLQIELNSPVRVVDSSPFSVDTGAGVGAGPSTTSSPLPDELIKLTTTTGVTYLTKTVVITSSPHVLKTACPPLSTTVTQTSTNPLMEFHPPLSSDIQEALHTTTMNPIVKVLLKFSAHPWPKNLHGMIIANSAPNNSFLLPEMWFRDVEDETAAHHTTTATTNVSNTPSHTQSDEVKEGEKETTAAAAVCYVVGFTTTEYAQKLMSLSHQEALSRVLSQMDEIFSFIEPQHMTGEAFPPSLSSSPSPSPSLPKPSEVYVGGTCWHWTPEHHPYIGGGYSSPVVGKETSLCDRLSRPYGDKQNIYFAGEVTSLPGATAHAALESGVRAADQVARHLRDRDRKSAAAAQE